MSIKITDGFMRLEAAGGKDIGTAVRRPDGQWEVTGWPRLLDRNEAITALTVTDLLASGYRADDPVVLALCEELS